MQSRRTNAIHFALFVVFPLLVLAFAASGRERVRFMPRFSPGEVLRYRIESRTTTSGTHHDPHHQSRGRLAIHPSHPYRRPSGRAGVSPAGEVHLRATYEKSSSESESDALDLQASSNADRYNGLEGRSFRVTIEPDGTFAAMPLRCGAVRLTGGRTRPFLAPEGFSAGSLSVLKRRRHRAEMEYRNVHSRARCFRPPLAHRVHLPPR